MNADVISIVPYLIDAQGHKRLVLIKEWRDQIGNFLIQTPSGTIESGETAIEATYRELEEETGLLVGRIRLIGPTVVRSIYKEVETTVVAYVEIFADRPDYWISPEGDSIQVMALDFPAVKKLFKDPGAPFGLDAFLIVSKIVERGYI